MIARFLVWTTASAIAIACCGCEKKYGYTMDEYYTNKLFVGAQNLKHSNEVPINPPSERGEAHFHANVIDGNILYADLSWNAELDEKRQVVLCIPEDEQVAYFAFHNNRNNFSVRKISKEKLFSVRKNVKSKDEFVFDWNELLRGSQPIR